MSDSQTLSYTRSLADIRIEQDYHLDQLRSKLSGLDMRDLVPQLVARHVLRSQEMSAVYSEEKREDQADKLIEILKTKNHWLGPLIDALIRNGQATLAKELLATNRSLEIRMMSTFEKGRIFKWQMSSMVDKVRRGVAKTIQAASEGEAFDKLPDCDVLGMSNRFAIKILPSNKLKSSVSNFTPIHLVIKDKKGRRQIIYNCEMIAAQGVVVKTLRGNTVMEIRLPDNSQNSMGKILHPAGSTLYKIEQIKSHSLGRKFMISKLGEPFLNILNTPITQIFGSISNILQYFYLINADQALEFFNLDNEKIGFLRPSYFSTAKSVIINYSNGATAIQERAAMLGASILFLIVAVRPEYGIMLQNTLH